MTRERSAGKPSARTRSTSSGEQPVSRRARDSAQRASVPHAPLLGQEDVAAVEADGERRVWPRRRRRGHQPVGDDPVGVDEVEAPPPELPAERPARAPRA